MSIARPLAKIPYLGPLLSRLLLNFRRRSARHRLRRMTRTTSPLRIVVGSGQVCPSGWIPTDQWFLDLLRPTDWHVCFKGPCIDAILAEHVWEHLTEEEGLFAARLCFEHLKPGGYLRAAVPDGFDPDPKHVARARPGGTGPGAGTHRVLYTWNRFKALFETAGFRVDMLEYYDAQGLFHAVEWDSEDGMIHRSKRFDKRTRPGEYHFASIILDARKEGTP